MIYWQKTCIADGWTLWSPLLITPPVEMRLCLMFSTIITNICFPDFFFFLMLLCSLSTIKIFWKSWKHNEIGFAWWLKVLLSWTKSYLRWNFILSLYRKLIFIWVKNIVQINLLHDIHSRLYVINFLHRFLNRFTRPQNVRKHAILMQTLHDWDFVSVLVSLFLLIIFVNLLVNKFLA